MSQYRQRPRLYSAKPSQEGARGIGKGGRIGVLG